MLYGVSEERRHPQTLDKFQLLVPPFEAAFHAHMREWRLDGKPRTARQLSI
jgi:hypothetical protein